MQLLLIVAVIVAVLWVIYWRLTRRRLLVRRSWSWRRLYLRTLDKALTDPSLQGLLAAILLSPLLVYWAARVYSVLVKAFLAGSPPRAGVSLSASL